MKQNKRGYLYICDNCDNEFYLKKLIRNRPVECPRCGEKSANHDEYMQDSKKDYKNSGHKKNKYDGFFESSPDNQY